jgi:hypothetical protein
MRRSIHSLAATGLTLPTCFGLASNAAETLEIFSATTTRFGNVFDRSIRPLPLEAR